MGVNWHDKRVWWATSFVAWTLISIAERFPRNWSSDSDRRFRRILSNGFCRTNSVERRWLPHPVVAMLGRGVSVLGKAGSHSAHTTSEHRGAGRQTPIVDSDRRFRRILSNGFCRTHSVELRPSMCSFAPRTSHIFGLNLNVSLTPAYGGPLACGVARHFVKPAPRCVKLRLQSDTSYSI